MKNIKLLPVLLMIFYCTCAETSVHADRARTEKDILGDYFIRSVLENRVDTIANSVFITNRNEINIVYGDRNNIFKIKNDIESQFSVFQRIQSVVCGNHGALTCIGTWKEAGDKLYRYAVGQPSAVKLAPGRLASKIHGPTVGYVPLSDGRWVTYDWDGEAVQFSGPDAATTSLKLDIPSDHIAELFRSDDQQIIAITYQGNQFAKIRDETWYKITENERPVRIVKGSRCNFLAFHKENYLCQMRKGKGYRLVLMDHHMEKIASWPIANRIPVRDYNYRKNVFMFTDTSAGRSRVMALHDGSLKEVGVCFGAEGDVVIGKSLLNARIALVSETQPVKPVRTIAISLDLADGKEFCEALKGKVITAKPSLFDTLDVNLLRAKITEKQIPITMITGPKSGVLAGKAIIQSYAAYGVVGTAEAYLGPTGRYWVAQGGTYVFAHARGSAGFGAEWRKAGSGTNKGNAADDLATVARYLVDVGLAKKGEIAAQGVSAGAVPAFVAAYKNPDLFGAIMVRSPCLILGKRGQGECYAGHEFGDPSSARDLKKMLAYSPVHLAANAEDIIPTLIVQMSGDTNVKISETAAFMAARPDAKLAEVHTFDSPHHGRFATLEDAVRGTLLELEWVAEKLGGKASDIYPKH